MGFFDIVAAALPWSDAEAEAVKGGASTESTPANDTEGSKGGDAQVCHCCFLCPSDRFLSGGKRMEECNGEILEYGLMGDSGNIR